MPRDAITLADVHRPRWPHGSQTIENVGARDDSQALDFGHIGSWSSVAAVKTRAGFARTIQTSLGAASRMSVQR
jgi:hypothetical protein